MRIFWSYLAFSLLALLLILLLPLFRPGLINEVTVVPFTAVIVGFSVFSTGGWVAILAGIYRRDDSMSGLGRALPVLPGASDLSN